MKLSSSTASVTFHLLRDPLIRCRCIHNHYHHPHLIKYIKGVVVRRVASVTPTFRSFCTAAMHSRQSLALPPFFPLQHIPSPTPKRITNYARMKGRVRESETTQDQTRGSRTCDIAESPSLLLASFAGGVSWRRLALARREEKALSFQLAPPYQT